jgi:hypothetical protein
MAAGKEWKNIDPEERKFLSGLGEVANIHVF